MNSDSQAATAVVLAAGKGTRMRSPTPKLLHRLLGETLISYPLRALFEAGIRRFVLVVGHRAEAVRSAVETLPFRSEIELHWVEQSEQRGTGHAVQLAMAQVPATVREVWIAYGDTPHLTGSTWRTLVAGRHAGPLVLLGAELDDPFGYGRLVVDEVTRKLAAIVEQKDASSEQLALRTVNAGAYVCDADFLRQGLPKLQPNNVQKELYLTDLIALATGQATLVLADDPAVAYGVNSQNELNLAEERLRRSIIAHWHEHGVAVAGDDVVIGPRVKVGAGTRIERGTTLLGACELAGNVQVEHHVHLEDTKVASGVTIHAFSYLQGALIGEHAQVGPFSRLRQGAELASSAEVGNFCEIKKSKLGEGSKAHHVSYLGDATIGARVNIGAGTIICNYDGFNKPHSEIGDGCFIGSNSTLVAPVKIGRDAYVAAGSTVTQPVADDDLAIGRARQENKAGYAKKLRAALRAKKAKP